MLSLLLYVLLLLMVHCAITSVLTLLLYMLTLMMAFQVLGMLVMVLPLFALRWGPILINDLLKLSLYVLTMLLVMFQVVGMLVMVLLLFALCWGPILINNVLTAWGYLHQLHYGYLKPMRQAFFLLSYINSCLNPIVYAFFSRNFRQSFKMAICACVKGKAFVRAYRYSISAASTRTSAVHYNGRTVTSMYERDTGTGSSENDMTRSPTSYSPESLELQKMSV